MPRAKDAKVWNEDLVEAFRAREIQCRQQGKARQHLWRDAAIAVEAVRKEIYAFSNNRIVNFPKLPSKTAEEAARQIILGNEPVYPPGYVPALTDPNSIGNPYRDDPYLKKIKIKGGAFALLMALHVSQKDVMTKEEICRIGQVFCDEPMDTNFLQGQPYAGWSSITTLERHHLVIRNSHVTFQARVGGFRYQGSHTFSLSNQGRQFIDALLEVHPQVQQLVQTQQTRGGGGVGGGGGGNITSAYNTNPYRRPAYDSLTTSSPTHTAARREISQYGATVVPTTPASAASSTAASSVSHRKVTPLMNKDEEELRTWVETARVGQQKEFKIGKDRRKHLNDVCEELNGILQLDGRHLRHESDGDTKARVLFVTVEGVQATRRPAHRQLFASTVSSSHPHVSRLEERFQSDTGGGHRLGSVTDEASPTKRLKPTAASQAVALAAIARQVDFVVSKPVVESMPKHNPPKNDAPTRKQQQQQQQQPAIEVIDVSDSDSDTDCKLRARFRQVAARTASDGGSTSEAVSKAILELLDDSDDDGDDHEFPPPSCFSALSTAALTATTKRLDRDLCIIIDSRERDRNATPRAMRMALTQMLSTGPLSLMWPSTWNRPTVEEQTLAIGDFAFDLRETSGQSFRLPVCVERKRVSDLVQRSAKKDHWRQLQRMRSMDSVDGSCIFLIEGDLRTAERFTAYGAQEMQVLTRNDFAIQDCDAAVRFLGRAILSCKCIRFIQTDAPVATYEAITAVAIVTALSKDGDRRKCPPPPNVDNERHRLVQKLTDGGIPLTISSCIGDEFGSIDLLASLYQRVTDEVVRMAMLAPLLEDVCRYLDSGSSAMSWSTAIHKVFFSNDSSAVKSIFHERKHLVEDDARLLCHLYSGIAPEQALDAVWAESKHMGLTPPRRLVHVVVQESLEPLFPWRVDSDDAFFRITTKSQFSRRVHAVPVVSIHTVCGDHYSDRLYVFVLEGAQFVRRLKNALDRCKGEYMQAAWSVAGEIAIDCHVSDCEDNDTRKILLLHALQPALDQAAKKPGYCIHSRFISHLILAQLMLVRRMVVLQAVRKSNDCEAMLQQLILSCYQFQLCTRSKTATKENAGGDGNALVSCLLE